MKRIAVRGRHLLAALGIAAQCLLGAQAQTRVFVIGVEDFDYYPLHSISKDSQFAGYAREVLDAFARDQGYRFVYRPLPINRLFAVFFDTNSLDFKYPDNPHWQAARRPGFKLSYSTPIVVSEEGALVLPGSKGRALAQLKTMGTMRGFTPWPYMAMIDDKSITFTTDDSFDGVLRQALAGHLDAVYMNVDVANYRLDQMRQTHGLVLDPGLPHTHSDFSLATQRHHDVIAQFNLFLLRQGALLQRLRGKYAMQDGRQ